MANMASVLISLVKSSSLAGRSDLGFSISVGENQSGSSAEVKDEAGLVGVDAPDVAEGVVGVLGRVLM